MNQYTLERAVLYLTILKNRREKDSGESSMDNPEPQVASRDVGRPVLVSLLARAFQQRSKGSRHKQRAY